MICTIVAVNKRGILPPCGRCRKMIAQLDPANMDTMVLTSATHAVPLKALLPDHWLVDPLQG